MRGRRCSMVQLRAAILEAEARADPALATAVAAYAAAAPPPVGAVLSGVAFNAFKAKDFNFLVGKRARAAGVSFNAGALSLGHALAMTIVEFLLARVPGVATPEWCLTAAHVRELAEAHLGADIEGILEELAPAWDAALHALQAKAPEFVMDPAAVQRLQRCAAIFALGAVVHWVSADLMQFATCLKGDDPGTTDTSSEVRAEDVRSAVIDRLRHRAQPIDTRTERLPAYSKELCAALEAKLRRRPAEVRHMLLEKAAKKQRKASKAADAEAAAAAVAGPLGAAGGALAVAKPTKKRGKAVATGEGGRDVARGGREAQNLPPKKKVKRAGGV